MNKIVKINVLLPDGDSLTLAEHRLPDPEADAVMLLNQAIAGEMSEMAAREMCSPETWAFAVKLMLAVPWPTKWEPGASIEAAEYNY